MTNPPNPHVFPLATREDEYIDANGITLREHYAGLAMAALISVCVSDSIGETPYPKHVARLAYEHADAMLAEGAKETP